MTAGLYKITNKIDGKIYVGISRNIEARWREHKKCRKNTYLCNAFRKYGIENFSFEIIYNEDEPVLLGKFEQVLILLYNTKAPNGYNMTDGGDGVMGYKHTDNVKEKISKAAKGREFSEEWKKNMSIAKMNQTEHTRKLISESKMGIKNAQYGVTGERHRNSKKIIDDKGNVYVSRRELVRSIGISQPTCSKRIHSGLYKYI